MTPTLAFIGGSGLYALDALAGRAEHFIDTPFGAPSDAIVTGELAGVPVAFVARHGRHHSMLPHEVPYRANLYALKTLGVRYILAVSAVGSLKEELAPLHMVLPDQFIDLTKSRQNTFFGDGAVAHVSMAQPVSAVLADAVAQAHADAGIDVPLHRGGTYIAMEGPQFSTLAESRLYRSWGASVIGMTNMPEARLAREAEIAYATLALVTDYDCWHPSEEPVTAEIAIGRLRLNAQNAQKLIAALAPRLAAAQPVCPAHSALASGLITPPAAMSPATRERLRALIARYA